MALGTYGTTLLDELNRLANGGTYRAPGAMVDEARAAKQWATFLSINTNLTDTVGILNAIAGRTGNSRLDYNGVCNLIAGTFQLPAAQALRSISGAPVVYAIGDTGPAGGIIFYDAGSTLSWGRYMEAAVSTTSPTWVDSGVVGTTTFATFGSSTAIGTGLANTNAMVAQNSTAGRAGTVCRSYTGGGKTDWFLPSKDELSQLYIRKTTIGGFLPQYYWSSSEIDATQLWIQYFVNGSVIANYKNNIAYIRAIRYV